MSEMTFEDFVAPSSLGPGGGAYPALHQLSGRLLHILPTAKLEGATTPLKKQPHTRITVELTFLDGKPITAVLDKNGNVTAEIDPPISAGYIMAGRWMNQTWFVNRLEGMVGRPGFPGMVGVLATEPTRSGQMWILRDPSPQQLASAKHWFAWRNEHLNEAYYRPSAGQAAAVQQQQQSYGPPATPVQQQQQQQQAWPFTAPATAAPAPATATDVPPWQR